MDAMHREESAHCGRQPFGHLNLDSVRGHHLLREDLLGEHDFDPVQTVGPDHNLHAQGSADEVTDRAQLTRMEVDGHEQQHLPKRGGRCGAAQLTHLHVLLVKVIFVLRKKII